MGHSVRARAALVLLVGLYSTEAHTSGRVDAITLKQVVAESSLIVVATPATPPSRRASVDITPPGEMPGPEYPPYGRTLTRWVVRELLQDEGTGLQPGATIEVDGGAFTYWLGIHRRRYVEKVNKIAWTHRYDPTPAGPSPGSERILFLRPTSLGLELVAEGSIETLAARPAIVKLIGTAKAEPASPIPSLPPAPPPPPRK